MFSSWVTLTSSQVLHSCMWLVGNTWDNVGIEHVPPWTGQVENTFLPGQWRYRTWPSLDSAGIKHGPHGRNIALGNHEMGGKPVSNFCTTDTWVLCNVNIIWLIYDSSQIERNR